MKLEIFVKDSHSLGDETNKGVLVSASDPKSTRGCWRAKHSTSTHRITSWSPFLERALAIDGLLNLTLARYINNAVARQCGRSQCLASDARNLSTEIQRLPAVSVQNIARTRTTTHYTQTRNNELQAEAGGRSAAYAHSISDLFDRGR